MAENKTKVMSRGVSGFFGSIADPRKRKDAKTLSALMRRVTGEKPVLWGQSIVGFGSYHYRYASGHQGDTSLAGFALRKTDFSIYLMGTYFPEQGRAREALLAKLGPHKMGKACLYLKSLEDIDLDILERLVHLSVTALKTHYPDGKGAASAKTPPKKH